MSPLDGPSTVNGILKIHPAERSGRPYKPGLVMHGTLGYVLGNSHLLGACRAY